MDTHCLPRNQKSDFVYLSQLPLIRKWKWLGESLKTWNGLFQSWNKMKSHETFPNLKFSLFPFRVLRVMNYTDMKLSQVGAEKLELALITFFDQFKKIYIGDQANKSSKVMKTPYWFSVLIS